MKGLTISKKKHSSKGRKEGSTRESIECSVVGGEQLVIMMDVQKKILAFRDIMDLAPCHNYTSIREVLPLYISFLVIIY